MVEPEETEAEAAPPWEMTIVYEGTLAQGLVDYVERQSWREWY